MGKLNLFFASNQIFAIKVKILESDPVKPVTHAVDLKMFPDIDFDNL